MYIYVSYWHLLLEFYIGNASKLCVDLGCFYDATNARDMFINLSGIAFMWCLCGFIMISFIVDYCGIYKEI